MKPGGKLGESAWMEHTRRRGIARIANAARFSLRGIMAAWRHEEAFRTELLLTILLTPVALWLGDNAAERTLLIGSCLVVLITELLNTAIEALTDRVGVEQHELSGLAKDLGSAAVFIGLLLAGLVWLLIAIE
jgi:diacylglycerol kinase (ATP)